MMTAMTVLLAQADAAAAAARPGMTAFSWLFMLVSMGGVTWLTVWSFARILRSKAHFDPDGTGPATPPVPGRTDRP